MIKNKITIYYFPYYSWRRLCVKLNSNIVLSNYKE